MSALPPNPVGLTSVPPCVAAPPMELPGAKEVVDRWFREEVHPHDSSLKAYLRSSFSTVKDVEDIVQESYVRVWKTKFARPIDSAKSFLFQVARHLAIDVVRRRRSNPTESLGDLSELPVMEEGTGTLDRLCYEEKVELLAAAFLHLPARCREIMTLRKLHSLPNPEIARRMGISVGTVESQITRGTKLCRQYLAERGVTSFNRE